MVTNVLQLDVSGRPQAWLSLPEAATLYAAGAVAWTLGDTFHVMRGGVQRATGTALIVGSVAALRLAWPCSSSTSWSSLSWLM